jgi:hypothetical protein
MFKGCGRTPLQTDGLPINWDNLVRRLTKFQAVQEFVGWEGERSHSFGNTHLNISFTKEEAMLCCSTVFFVIAKTIEG